MVQGSGFGGSGHAAFLCKDLYKSMCVPPPDGSRGLGWRIYPKP